MDSEQILPLLGLCLRGGRLAVGEEPVEAVARTRDARVLFLASDAADNTRRRQIRRGGGPAGPEGQAGRGAAGRAAGP